ncbi:MAG: hypothetical protein RLY86_2971 [Pseudomonadota bacterium]|jgi:hypothetical protein
MMMRSTVFILLAILCATPARAQRSDDDIKRQIIQESIANYPGPCACPYSSARNGSRCGQRSAYSKPGGASPLCYPDDVTPAMMDRWRKARAPAPPKVKG